MNLTPRRHRLQPSLLAIDADLYRSMDLPVDLDADLTSRIRLQAKASTVGEASAAMKPIDPTTRVGAVAVIDIAGKLSYQPDWARIMGCYNTATLAEIEMAIDRAAADNQVAALLLNVDSPGGTVTGTPEVADAVLRARERKRVVAHTRSMMGSAAYWIGSQAHEIYISRTAAVGSIGAFALIPDQSGALEREGLKLHVVSSAPGKGPGPNGSVSEEMLENFQARIDETAAVFVRDVARGRGINQTTADALHDGQAHVGAAALARTGLVDDVRDFNSVLSELLAEQPSEISRPKPRHLAAELAHLT